MSLLASIFILLSSAILATDGPKGPDASLEGVWKMETRETNGQETDRELLKRQELRIEGKKFKLTVNGNENVMTYRLPASKEPLAIDLISGMGKDERLFLGIYELKGDTLKILRAVRPANVPQFPGSRPEKFEETFAGSGTVLEVWKRQAK